MHKSIHILYDEHRSIAAVLHGLRALARIAKDPKLQPEFTVFHAMIHYIDAFPERLHHPKEDDFLFSLLAVRAPEARPLIEELMAEHSAGKKLIRDLQAKLLAFEIDGRDSLPAFVEAVEAYARFHWDHMRKEESRLLPLAERYLTEADWRQIDDAFASNEDPIADLHEEGFEKREEGFERLYQRIVSLAPDPIGLGERWKKNAA